jgi:hypothetical protein
VPLSALAAALLLFACGPAESRPPATSGPEALDHAALAEALSERLDLQPGERILLVGVPGRFDPLAEGLRAGARAAGAEDLGAYAVEGEPPEAWSTPFTDGLAGAAPEDLPEVLADVDVAVMMPGATTTHAAYAAMQDVLRGGSGRTVHFHWAGAYSLDGVLLDQTPRFDAFYQDVLLRTDYAALGRAQSRFESAMRGSDIRVTTPAGTDIRFRIGDRPVTRQDGDASAARAARARNLIDREVELPAGAIRVAPIEESVQGTIVFPPSFWGGSEVRGLRLKFDGGTVTDVSADVGVEAAVEEMDAAGPAGRAFREFALGFNPLLAVPSDGEPWIPYYGYGAGVVRLSLGDNTELGGAVGGGYVRWNFFTDATVSVNGDTWVREGRLVR